MIQEEEIEEEEVQDQDQEVMIEEDHLLNQDQEINLNLVQDQIIIGGDENLQNKLNY